MAEASFDTHFYVDNAPPKEVIKVLQVLSSDTPLSPADISTLLGQDYGFHMQGDVTYSPRRLLDLRLVDSHRKGAKALYRLTPLGEKVQRLLNSDWAFGLEILHYLHFTGFSGAPSDRKLLWSYRRCCDCVWANGYVVEPKKLAATIQSLMTEEFPGLDAHAPKGARFNSTAVSAVYTWLRALTPPAVGNVGERLIPRSLSRFELSLLALDDTYRNRGMQYGDPVLLDDELLMKISGVFFMKPQVCWEQLRVAATLTPYITFSDTLAGPSVRLMAPVTIDHL